MPFPRSAEAVSDARLFVVNTLLGLKRFDDEVTEDFRLITGELFANAVQHAVGDGDIVVTTAVTVDRLRVTVTGPAAVDGASPRRQAKPSRNGERGRGLFIVDALCDDWGFGSVEGDRTAVWAEKEIAGALLQRALATIC
jgi:anti-sigma regulatory factor (Ser/Thr protein kinase)